MKLNRAAIETWLVGLFAFILMLASIHTIPLVWDEGFTLDRQIAMEQWFGRLWQTSSSEWANKRLFSRATLDQSWRFSKEEPDGHSPFYCLLCHVGHVATRSLLGPPASYRVGTAALFALTCSAIFRLLRDRHRSTLFALIAVGIFAFLPRVVPEVSFALIDGPLFCLAMLSFVCFCHSRLLGDFELAAPDHTVSPEASEPAKRLRIGWLMLFGIAIGCAMATKLTGWFLPMPYILSVAIYFTPKRLGWLIAAGLVAAITCFALNVGWWFDPVTGITRYFQSNLTRKETIAIPILFAGQVYPFSLPWYNTLVWTLIAVPISTVILALLGVGGSIRAVVSRSPTRMFSTLLLVNWLLIIVLRALPQAPGHDGTRQIIISFGFLSLLATEGLSVVVRWFCTDKDMSAKAQAPQPAARRAPFALIIGLLAVAESVGSTLLYHPHGLSYYSPVIGGLPGATKAGFEPTYFFDGVTPEVRDWLADHTIGSPYVLFRNNATWLTYLQEWRQLKVETRPNHWKMTPIFVVYQNRPGLYDPLDRKLISEAKPAYTKTLFGVPIIMIYPYETWQAIRQAQATSSNK